MRATILEHLVCPDCLGALALSAEKVEGDWIDAGKLACNNCNQSWPIEQGVPNFVAAADRHDVQQTTSGFARNWDEFNQIINSYKALNDELFRDWILPVDPESMRGKLVLEAGCGMGRWLRVASEYQPRVLIGVDYSAIAYTAARNLRELPNAHIIRADILHMPLRQEMELTYCLGVVHHTPDPGRTFDALVGKLAVGGAMTVWVYGAEGNGWIHKVVTPLREKVTSKLPHGILAGLSKVLAFQLYASAAAYKLGLEKIGFPYAPYLAYLRRYPFKYMEHIVYDHLVPEIAHYHSRDELVAWAERNGLFFKLSPRNGNSWRLLVSRDRELVPEAESPRQAASAQ